MVYCTRKCLFETLLPENTHLHLPLLTVFCLHKFLCALHCVFIKKIKKLSIYASLTSTQIIAPFCFVFRLYHIAYVHYILHSSCIFFRVSILKNRYNSYLFLSFLGTVSKDVFRSINISCLTFYVALLCMLLFWRIMIKI